MIEGLSRSLEAGAIQQAPRCGTPPTPRKGSRRGCPAARSRYRSRHGDCFPALMAASSGQPRESPSPSCTSALRRERRTVAAMRGSAGFDQTDPAGKREGRPLRRSSGSRARKLGAVGPECRILLFHGRAQRLQPRSQVAGEQVGEAPAARLPRPHVWLFLRWPSQRVIPRRRTNSSWRPRRKRHPA